MRQLTQMTTLMSLNHAYGHKKNPEKFDFVLFQMLNQNMSAYIDLYVQCACYRHVYLERRRASNDTPWNK